MQFDVKELQAALRKKGFDLGKSGPNGDGVDGIMGPLTERAIIDFKRSVGLLVRAYVGPITWKKLTGKNAPEPPTVPASDQPAPTGLPWINEITRMLGRHESYDYKMLSEWLKSDGGTVGDPRRIPWCGDAVHTAIRLALRDEKFPGALGVNPYLARNWRLFGKKAKGRPYGAVVPCWRGSPTSISGHVGFLIGVSKDAKRLRLRGGNQSDRVSDMWISADRALDFRVPATWPYDLPPAPIMNAAGAVLSTNEA